EVGGAVDAEHVAGRAGKLHGVVELQVGAERHDTPVVRLVGHGTVDAETDAGMCLAYACRDAQERLEILQRIDPRRGHDLEAAGGPRPAPLGDFNLAARPGGAVRRPEVGVDAVVDDVDLPLRRVVRHFPPRVVVT